MARGYEHAPSYTFDFYTTYSAVSITSFVSTQVSYCYWYETFDFKDNPQSPAKAAKRGKSGLAYARAFSGEWYTADRGYY